MKPSFAQIRKCIKMELLLWEIFQPIWYICCKKIKQNSTTTFVEAFDFMQDHLQNKCLINTATFITHLVSYPRSLVPHASSSFRSIVWKIRTFTEQAIISIHNQEVKDEDELFESKGGGFIPFFEGFGFDYSHFQAKTYNAPTTTSFTLDKKIPNPVYTQYPNTLQGRQKK